MFTALLFLAGLLLRADPGPAPADPPPEPPADPPEPKAKAEPKADPKAEQPADPKADPDAGDPRVQRANAQAATERVKRREAEERSATLLRALGPVLTELGIKVEGLEADPERLAGEARKWQAKYRDERVTNALHRAAAKANAKPEMLGRWLRGGSELADLDPEAPDFEANLDAIVQAAVTSEPILLATPPAGPSRSGPEFSGSGGKSLDEQIAEAEKSGDYRTSTRLKLAKQALSSPTVS